MYLKNNRCQQMTGYLKRTCFIFTVITEENLDHRVLKACTWRPKEQEGEIESIEMLSPVLIEKPPGHILMRSLDVLALMFTEHFIF